MVIVPAQVGPGECTTTLMGDTACYHPNALYLNGSGEEFLQADGSGAWRVKHSWVLGGEGYQNWELILEEDYGEGLWVEGILLGDDTTMNVGDLDDSDGGFYNLRRPFCKMTPLLIVLKDIYHLLPQLIFHLNGNVIQQPAPLTG